MTRRFLFRAEVAQAERFDHSVGPRDSDAYSAGLFTIDPCAFAIQRLAFHKGVLTVETAPMCFVFGSMEMLRSSAGGLLCHKICFAWHSLHGPW